MRSRSRSALRTLIVPSRWGAFPRSCRRGAPSSRARESQLPFHLLRLWQLPSLLTKRLSIQPYYSPSLMANMGEMTLGPDTAILNPPLPPRPNGPPPQALLPLLPRALPPTPMSLSPLTSTRMQAMEAKSPSPSMSPHHRPTRSISMLQHQPSSPG